MELIPEFDNVGKDQSTRPSLSIISKIQLALPAPKFASIVLRVIQLELGYTEEGFKLIDCMQTPLCMFFFGEVVLSLCFLN